MQKSKAELEARKAEILAFLKKHFESDPTKLGNFLAKFPNYSRSDLNMDESSEVSEVVDYERDLAIEHTLEEELMKIDEQLAKD